MRSFRIIIVLLFVGQAAFAQSIVNLINRADLFFETMSQGQFDEAYDFFDESVKAKLSKDELKLFWLRLENSMGTYDAVNGAQNRVQGDYFEVTLDCGFSKGSQPFTFVFNQSEKLVGFFAVPKPDEIEYVLPAYADTSLYSEEEIIIRFEGGQMAGVLTKPRGVSGYPVVVLVHGSGPFDMDETVGPNKPFKDLALGLAAKGIATVRYVKRTMVHPTLFNHVFTVKEEVTDDAITAINLARALPGVNKNEVFLLGHSLGGMLAPRIASHVSGLKGIILAAAPARKFADVITEQNHYLYTSSGDTSSAMKQQYMEAIDEIGRSGLLKLGDIAPDSVILSAPAAYWIDLNNYDQLNVAKKLKNRILVIQGENDFQVSVQDFNLWKDALSANNNAAFKLYPDLNHLLSSQKEKGNGMQYRSPANVSEQLIDDIATWIKEK